MRIEELSLELSDKQKEELEGILYERIKTEVEKIDIKEAVKGELNEFIRYIFAERMEGGEIARVLENELREIMCGMVSKALGKDKDGADLGDSTTSDKG